MPAPRVELLDVALGFDQERRFSFAGGSAYVGCSGGSPRYGAITLSTGAQPGFSGTAVGTGSYTAIGDFVRANEGSTVSFTYTAPATSTRSALVAMGTVATSPSGCRVQMTVTQATPMAAG